MRRKLRTRCSLLLGRVSIQMPSKTLIMKPGDGWCWWALTVTAFDPQNWTQCVAPRLMGLTLTVMIHQYLRSLTLKVYWAQFRPRDPSPSQEQQKGSLQSSDTWTNSHKACTRQVCAPHHARGLRIRFPCGLKLLLKQENCGQRGEKNETLRGPHPSGLPTLGAPTLRGPHPSGPPSGLFF